jgi:hypothetical protein
VYEAMLAIAEAPLSTLIEPAVQIQVGAVNEWRLPEPDRRALHTYGLPDGPMLRPRPQEVPEPVLVPNVAGERERRLIAPNQRLYLLGVCGTDHDPELTIRVGAVAETGQVLGIRARPVTTADIHIQLREVYPDLYHPSVCYFNASIAAFVEVAWRWRAAVELIRSHKGPHYSAPYEEHERHHAEVQECCEMFLARMTELDPTLSDENLESVWIETITEEL